MGAQKADRQNFLFCKEFTRVDQFASVWLQWAVWGQEYEDCLKIPKSLQDYLKRAQERPSFENAIGQHGKKAFPLSEFVELNKGLRKCGKCCGFFTLLLLITAIVVGVVLAVGA